MIEKPYINYSYHASQHSQTEGPLNVNFDLHSFILLSSIFICFPRYIEDYFMRYVVHPWHFRVIKQKNNTTLVIWTFQIFLHDPTEWNLRKLIPGRSFHSKLLSNINYPWLILNLSITSINKFYMFSLLIFWIVKNQVMKVKLKSAEK